jgi:hypothetical protein
VTGTVVVRVDASDGEDLLGTLKVEVSTDGGKSWRNANWASGSSYDYIWTAPGGADGIEYTLIARARDASGNVTKSTTVAVTSNDAETLPDAERTQKSAG